MGWRPPATGVKTLHKYIAELRKVLAPGLLGTEGHGYVVSVTNDLLGAARFERLVGEADRAASAGDLDGVIGLLADAEGLWRGDVLADFPDAGFAAPERARLGELRFADHDRYRRLKDDLVLYRLTFGQPRQEDLVELL